MPDTELEPPFQAYDGAEPFIFVSYSHKDAAIVFPELKELHDLGYCIWFDEGIDPGNEWPEEIAKALKRSALFLVFISPNAVASRNVRNEIHLALSKIKNFVAVHLCETELPDGLDLSIGSTQAVLKHRMSHQNYRRKMEKALPNLLRKHPAPSSPTTTPLVFSQKEQTTANVRMPRTLQTLPHPLTDEDVFSLLVSMLKPEHQIASREDVVIISRDLGMSVVEAEIFVKALDYGGKEAFLDFVPVAQDQGYSVKAFEADYDWRDDATREKVTKEYADLQQRLKDTHVLSERAILRRRLAEVNGAVCVISIPCVDNNEFVAKRSRFIAFRRVVRLLAVRKNQRGKN